MSPRDLSLLVNDILDAIAAIRTYVEGLDADAFAADRKTVDAVVRNLITIGEAARQVPADVADAQPQIPWRLMGDMRNFAVHHYWDVDAAILWRTIQDDLPPLVPELKKLIS